jgi:CubicO group peptidase (beta-lactamase class C family)
VRAQRPARRTGGAGGIEDGGIVLGIQRHIGHRDIGQVFPACGRTDDRVQGLQGEDRFDAIRQVRQPRPLRVIGKDKARAAIPQGEGLLIAGPPAIQRHGDGARQQRPHEDHRPLRQIAHRQRHTLAFLQAARRQQRRDMGGGAGKGVEADAIVFIDQEFAAAMGAGLGEKLARRGGHILPHPHRHAAHHRLDDLERHARRGQARMGIIQGQRGPVFVIHRGASITRSMNSPSGFSQERLARIPRFLEGQVAAGALPGALTLIWRRGEIAHQSLVGLTDIARGTAMREDAIFRIYSMTKPVTAVALLMLLEEGRIALDDKVTKFIPGFAELKVQNGPMKRAMTVLDLLRHTAGLTYGFHNRTPIDAQYRGLRISEMDTPGGLPAMIAQLESVPLEYSPGDNWIYSVATDVVGYLVQLVSGQSYADFVRQRILAPLKMTDTDFLVPEGKRERFAACYLLQPTGLALFDAYPNKKYFAPPRLESGGGGLVSTAADYLRFCRMLLNRGELDGVRLLSPKTVALMTANHLPDGAEIADMSPAADAFNESGYRGIGFGLCVAVMLDPVRAGIPGTAGEFAWGGMASTAFFVDPKEDMAVVFMTQAIVDTARRVKLRRELRSLIYGAMTESHA